MGWIRYESGLLKHPKWQRVPAASRPDAIALHVACSGYASDFLTDGFVPTGVIAGLALSAGVRRHKMVLQQLFSSTLFDHRDGGVQIHDYLDFNPSAAEVKEQRRADAERKKLAREAKKRQMSGPDVLADVQADVQADVRGGIRADPRAIARERAPIPSHVLSSSSSVARPPDDDDGDLSTTLLQLGWYASKIPAALADPERARAWIRAAQARTGLDNPGAYSRDGFESGAWPQETANGAPPIPLGDRLQALVRNTAHEYTDTSLTEELVAMGATDDDLPKLLALAAEVRGQTTTPDDEI